ncbi:MAG: aminopeptidase [Candidatus Neomarinimicrobiota bacterium]|nr:C1 family peptidase [Candidatus Neomarinimicrobiota bacterium]RKY51433.1 MAG: aminopeptidase [Candidatus Neomarinimicrobiota bacterium]
MTKRHITTQFLSQCRGNLKDNPPKHVLRNSIIQNGIDKTVLNHDSTVQNIFTFSHEIPTGKITNQEKSGRCWIFAALNTFRFAIAQKIKVKDFELSQSYPLFWDKFEKSNYFLENIIETRNETTDSRIVMWLMKNPVQDGGQWDMFAGLVEKYGIVPKQAMPETFHSSNTHRMNQLLTLKLRASASRLREMAAKGAGEDDLRTEKEQILEKIYDMLVSFLGNPPVSFDFEYRDDDKKYHDDRNLTPLTFYEKYLDKKPADYISVIHAPTEDKPFMKTYTVQFLGSVLEGRPVKYLNVDIKTLKSLALAQLKAGEPVWFGCDVGQLSDRESGVMDTQLFLYEDALETTFDLDKAGRLNYGESMLTHAMVFTGVHCVNEKPVRWKVENSWSEKSGKEGFFIMTDEWFDEYNYQVVIHKKYLSPELRQAAEQKPVVLKPWDPMGSLAFRF